jgi:hypothetical protein
VNPENQTAAVEAEWRRDLRASRWLRALPRHSPMMIFDEILQKFFPRCGANASVATRMLTGC